MDEKDFANVSPPALSNTKCPTKQSWKIVGKWAICPRVSRDKRQTSAKHVLLAPKDPTSPPFGAIVLMTSPICAEIRRKEAPRASGRGKRTGLQGCLNRKKNVANELLFKSGKILDGE